MEVTREELNPCTLKLTVVCDPQQVTDGFNRAFKQISKSVKLPGFRPGHAPRAMLENLVSRDELYETAADNVIRVSFRKVMEREQIQSDPSVQPRIQLTKIDRDTSEVEYTAKIPLLPQITLGEYKGLPLKRPPLDVTEEEIEQQLTEFRKRRQTREAVTDRGVETGDVAVVNIKAEGEEGEGRTFMTIAGQTFAELDEALLGMHAEEMKNLELSFPEGFQEKDWAGQTHKVQMTLNSLSAVKLPELDDEFAKSLQTESVEDLRERITEALRSAKKRMVRDLVTDQLLERLHERSTVHVSDNMWEALAEQRMSETAEEQGKEGKSLEQYAAENGMTIEQLDEAWKSKAKLHIERALLIREVFTAENMQLTNEELNRELYAMAEEYEVDPERMFKMLQENNSLDELRFRSISNKVNDFLEANADSGEGPAPAEAEAPAEVAEEPAAAAEPATE